jgi:hypothetical protein
MGRISKQVIFLSIFIFSGCKQDAILVLPKEYCIVRKYDKIYQINIEITSIDKDSLILADYFSNKGDSNRFCLKNWENDFESGWSKGKVELVYKNCNYVVEISFQDDRVHQPLKFSIDSMGDIKIDSHE